MIITSKGVKPINKSVESIKLLHGSSSKEKIRENLRKRRKTRKIIS